MKNKLFIALLVLTFSNYSFSITLVNPKIFLVETEGDTETEASNVVEPININAKINATESSITSGLWTSVFSSVTSSVSLGSLGY